MRLTPRYYGVKNALKKIITQEILSPSNKENCIRLLKSMKPINTKTDKSNKNAAVLVPLCSINGELALLYTIRSYKLKTNRGHVSFPGGMSDARDQSLKQTALRETFEEIGIPGSAIDVWSKGPEIRRPDLVITPFLGYIGELAEHDLDTNSDEVAGTFALDLQHLCSPENFRTTQFRPKQSPSYALPVYMGGKEKIWGLTALITHLFLSAIVPNHYHNKVKTLSMVTSQI
ncbi:UNVERIFIED_CONTAM: hypothetical protein PYX00_002757 [Menopon gallinae]|uniref:Nudix hydrolase domain-containing protein n=1 Tax=Menopon gallinae TaxID=328185 RepID=A0AAW2HXS9_9NEOP